MITKMAMEKQEDHREVTWSEDNWQQYEIWIEGKELSSGQLKMTLY